MQDTRRTRGLRLIPLTCGLLALGVTISIPQTAQAQTVYVSYENNEFGTLNLATGHFTQISTLATTLFGMGFMSDGTLYGVDADSELYQVDPLSGDESLKGHIGPDAVFTATASGGVLYGLTGNSSAVLFSINPATQQPTDLNLATGISPDGLFASNGGTLYATSTTDATGAAVSTLYRFTASGGTPTAVGSTGFVGYFGAGVFAGSTLYGFSSDGNIDTLNTSTGVASKTASYDLGSTGDFIFAAALAPAPEPSQAAALGLGVLGLAGLALRARRRRTDAA